MVYSSKDCDAFLGSILHEMKLGHLGPRPSTSGSQSARFPSHAAFQLEEPVRFDDSALKTLPLIPKPPNKPRPLSRKAIRPTRTYPSAGVPFSEELFRGATVIRSRGDTPDLDLLLSRAPSPMVRPAPAHIPVHAPGAILRGRQFAEAAFSDPNENHAFTRRDSTAHYSKYVGIGKGGKFQMLN